MSQLYQQIDSNKRKTYILMFLFVVFICLITWIFSKSFGWGYEVVFIAGFFSIITSLYSYYGGYQVALSSAGAKEISNQNNPYLYRMVENLSITAGIKMPKVYIIPDNAINAFATGRDPEHSHIAVTSGAIEKLENEELEGVIAHEMSHIKNYDIRLMTIVIICVGIITLLSQFFLRGRLFSSRDNDKGSGQLGAILVIIGLVLAILSPLFAQLIQLAVSRKREYLADASGALLTRYADGLANALEKIKLEDRQLIRTNKATAHLYISSPFKIGANGIGRAFATHPPIDDRIKKLRAMSI
ncbi:MAG: M48 family metallopeptidase [Patescibacteria group bacterium]|nr:M48 family metallopeptidase [Patescibacteria group bacterium]MDD4695000.1 M48 family metallopeptidase [Patescibacteria group bacterium]